MSYVYEPSDDSELLKRVARDYADSATVALDIGTGTGIVAAALRDAGCDEVTAVDINRAACQRAVKTTRTIQAHVTTPFKEDSADLITFNPPYLPEDERETPAERRAHGDGGEALRAFVKDVPRVLRDTGVALLVVSTRTPIDVGDAVAKQGLTVTEEAKRTLQFETLRVISLRHAD